MYRHSADPSRLKASRGLHGNKGVWSVISAVRKNHPGSRGISSNNRITDEMKKKPSSRVLTRYFSSRCSEKDKLQVEKWAAENPRNMEMFSKLKEIWDLSSEVKTEWDPVQTLRSLSAKIAELEREDRRDTGREFKLYRIVSSRRVSRFPMKAVLQSVSALVGFAGLLYFAIYFRNQALQKAEEAQNESFMIQEASTNPGQQVSLRFADGTKVVLNSDSELKYSTTRAGVRNVYLSGEAYFEVVHSKAHPFIVHVQNGTIRDVGTKFDVRAWPGDETTRVAVVEGMVSLHPRNGSGKPVIIHGDQYSIVGNNSVLIPPTNASVLNDIEWMKGQHVFQNKPVYEIIRQIWRSYGIHCFVSDTSILSSRLTTSFDNRDPAKRVLDMIALSLDLKYKVSRDSVYFIPERPGLESRHATTISAGRRRAEAGPGKKGCYGDESS